MTTREQAILILDIEASNPGFGCTTIAEAIGASDAADALAAEAWWACFPLPVKEARLRAAEAACLLREGWSPGGPVYLVDE